MEYQRHCATFSMSLSQQRYHVASPSHHPQNRELSRDHENVVLKVEQSGSMTAASLDEEMKVQLSVSLEAQWKMMRSFLPREMVNEMG